MNLQDRYELAVAEREAGNALAAIQPRDVAQCEGPSPAEHIRRLRWTFHRVPEVEPQASLGIDSFDQLARARG